jgi:trk system potassium uptake protein
MKIIICGVGRVGLSIASYLSLKDNQITIIDSDPHLVKRVSDTFDIIGIVGHASQPDILKRAGAEDADIIIAVTDSDEINMVACQVAHSVFGISKKIARIRNKEYKDPAWSNLFSRNHMPIDVIISPEEEIAEAIVRRMSVPGTTNDISLADNNVHISGFIISEGSQLIGNKVSDIYYSNRDLEFKIAMIWRENKIFACLDSSQIMEGDEIYFTCARPTLFNILERLGNNNNIYNGNIVICGGGVIGEAIYNKIKETKDFFKHDIIIIENDVSRARYLSRHAKDALILQGSALDYTILSEANVAKTSVFVTVMNSNENNILSAVLAKKMGAQYSIALSTNRLYSQLLPDRFVDAIVNPETITVSRILHNLRRGHIRSMHSIRDTGMEIIEAEVTSECGIANIPIQDLNLNKHINIMAIYDPIANNVIIPTPKTIIKAGNIVIISSYNVDMSDIERLFSFSIQLF